MYITINNKEIEAKELEGYCQIQLDDLQTKEYLLGLLDMNKMPSEYKISIPYRTYDSNSFGYYEGCFYNNSVIHYDYKKRY